MFAVIFEVEPTNDGKQEYLDIAATRRPALGGIDGFISIERFASLNTPSIERPKIRAEIHFFRIIALDLPRLFATIALMTAAKRLKALTEPR